MMTVTFPEEERWDEELQEFKYYKAQSVNIEHSLVSLAKWESKWNKPFLTKDPTTYEESIDYFKCMTITPNVDPNIWYRLTDEQIRQINDYIDAPMTATWFNERDDKTYGKKRSSEQITSEIIYYWMIALQIPFECQKWHLNRLLTLVKVCNIKNTPPKKMSKADIMSKNRSLNAARRAKMGSKG